MTTEHPVPDMPITPPPRESAPAAEDSGRLEANFRYPGPPALQFHGNLGTENRPVHLPDRQDEEDKATATVLESSSKYWFTTSFLQPLLYLVTSQVPKNCQRATSSFFAGAQTAVGLLQTTQIKQGVSFIGANKVYTRTNKTTIVWIETELFLLPRVDATHVYVRALALGCFYSHISTRTFRRALTASLDSCAETKSAPSVA